ncbi:MFS transporter [Georgenia yuyongxinii]|uniref:MFS transporter n=1 Tax=Georgenia yuyongxinii TaxID=2589797 RepID=A0A552WSB5_9MICO|nr:MFS transporter [Georgenia yuyongxinii]TRW45607.1 MFS transporter [Georgenia yuyongxinii]
MTTRTGADRLWTRDFVLAAVVNFFISAVFYMLMTTMALYAVDRFGVGDTGAGLAAGMFIIGAVGSRLFAGKLVDVLGHRRVLLVALVVFLLAALGYLPAGSFPALLGVRFVHGLTFGVGSTASHAIGQSLIPPSRRGEGTGFFGVSAVLATAVGPFTAVLLIDGPGYGALFTAASVAAAAAMAIALVLRVPEALPDPNRREALWTFRREDLLDPAVLPIATFMGVTAAAYSGILTFLNPYALSLGLAAAASTFFLVYAVVVLVGRPLMGRVQDAHGDNVVVYPALASFGAAFALLTVGSSRAIIGAGVLVGLGWGTVMSSCQAVAVKAVPPSRVGVAVSTYFFMVDVGTGLGPVLLGWLVGATGYRTMYAVSAGLVALAAVLYHLVHGRVARRVRPAHA